MSELSDALAAYSQVKQGWMRTKTLGDEIQIYRAADRAIQALTAEVYRLWDQVDTFSAPAILYCADRDHETMMAQSTDALPGTILRATDTLREWRMVPSEDGRVIGWVEHERGQA